MADATLPFGYPGDRKTSIWTADAVVIPRRGPLRGGTPSEICICEKEGLHVVQVVTNPTDHTEMVS